MMNSNRKKQKTAAWIGSIAGILIVAAILITLNAILKPLNWRWDCTEDKRYTLSRGSENILSIWTRSSASASITPAMRRICRYS